MKKPWLILYSSLSDHDNSDRPVWEQMIKPVMMAAGKTQQYTGIRTRRGLAVERSHNSADAVIQRARSDSLDIQFYNGRSDADKSMRR